MSEILKKLKNGVIVSVQAAHGEPLNAPEMLCALAESALRGGACGLRMAQPENIAYFKARHPEVPVLAITKPEVIPENACELVYITPTFEDIRRLMTAVDPATGQASPPPEIIALDATSRPRPGDETLDEIVSQARTTYPGLLLMADIATLDEGLNAERLGFDLISTTLSGYTAETRCRKASEQSLSEAGVSGANADGPDFELLSALAKRSQTPIILEGRVWEPSEVTHAFELGAFAVVIGSAVTRPHEITRRFVRAIPAIDTVSA